jgi:hypothetical protein
MLAAQDMVTNNFPVWVDVSRGGGDLRSLFVTGGVCPDVTIDVTNVRMVDIGAFVKGGDRFTAANRAGGSLPSRQGPKPGNDSQPNP